MRKFFYFGVKIVCAFIKTLTNSEKKGKMYSVYPIQDNG